MLLDLLLGFDEWRGFQLGDHFFHFIFLALYFYACFVLANYFVTTMRAEEEITRIHFRPRVARFFILF